MTANPRIRNPGRSAGQAAIELALVLPFMLLLGLAIVDFARMIQFSIILTSISREGASLASRTTEDPQYIIGALTSAAEPIDMSSDGMVYITKIVGVKKEPRCNDDPPGTCQTIPTVDAQYRTRVGGNRQLLSNVWRCTTWQNDGSCLLPNPHPAATVDITLRDGETVYAVESIYDYRAIVQFVAKTISNFPASLYSQSIM